MKNIALLFLLIPGCALPQTGKVTYSFLNFDNVVLGINDRGQVLTTATAGISTLTSALFTADGQSLPFIFEDEATGQPSLATALNTRNEFVGRASDTSKGYVLYQSGTSGGAERLQVVENAGPRSFISPIGMNDAGAIVGTYQDPDSKNSYIGFLYQLGKTTTIAFPGGVDTLPVAINDSGAIVGSFNDAAHQGHGFIYTPDGIGGGKYVQFDVPYATYTEIDGINNLGELAGTYVGQKGVGRGFVYSEGKVTTINYPFEVGIISVTGINEEGQVCGYTSLGGPGFVATPSYFSGF